MKYFRNVKNNNKYATKSEFYINLFTNNKHYKRISKTQYDKLEDIF